MTNETHIRNDQTRRCIEALPREVWPIVAGMNGPTQPVSTISCRLALESLLLLPDQQEAAHPSPDYTRGREQGLRDALEALPGMTMVVNGGKVIDECAEAIEALLPRPDPAKELVKAWSETGDFGQALIAEQWSDDLDLSMHEHFARWLHTTGRLATQGEVR